MHVICKGCGSRISVSHRPKGSTSSKGVSTSGNVRIEGGKISLGPGGGISFGPGGSIGFGRPLKSSFTCTECGQSYEYASEEIVGD